MPTPAMLALFSCCCIQFSDRHLEFLSQHRPTSLPALLHMLGCMVALNAEPGLPTNADTTVRVLQNLKARSVVASSASSGPGTSVRSSGSLRSGSLRLASIQ